MPDATQSIDPLGLYEGGYPKNGLGEPGSAGRYHATVVMPAFHGLPTGDVSIPETGPIGRIVNCLLLGGKVPATRAMGAFASIGEHGADHRCSMICARGIRDFLCQPGGM